MKLDFYKWAHFLLFLLSALIEFTISIAFLCHLYCYTKVYTLILYIPTMISFIICIYTQIPDPDFKKIVTLVQKQTLPFVTTP